MKKTFLTTITAIGFLLLNLTVNAQIPNLNRNNPISTTQINVKIQRNLIAINPDGQWVLICKGNITHNGLNQNIITAIQDLKRRKKVIDAVAFMPYGGYVIVAGDEYKGYKMPSVFKTKLESLLNQNKEIRSIAFNTQNWTDNKPFVILYKGGFEAVGIDNEMRNKLTEYKNANKRFDAVAFTPLSSGWTLIAGSSNWTKRVGGKLPAYYPNLKNFSGRTNIHSVAFNPKNYTKDKEWIVVGAKTYVAKNPTMFENDFNSACKIKAEPTYEFDKDGKLPAKYKITLKRIECNHQNDGGGDIEIYGSVKVLQAGQGRFLGTGSQANGQIWYQSAKKPKKIIEKRSVPINKSVYIKFDDLRDIYEPLSRSPTFSQSGNFTGANAPNYSFLVNLKEDDDHTSDEIFKAIGNVSFEARPHYYPIGFEAKEYNHSFTTGEKFPDKITLYFCIQRVE